MSGITEGKTMSEILSREKYHMYMLCFAEKYPLQAQFCEAHDQAQRARLEAVEKAVEAVRSLKVTKSSGIGPLFDAGISAGFDCAIKAVNAAIDAAREPAPAERDPQIQILRLLGESATLRNQLSQSDSYLAGIARERERLARDGEALTAEWELLNALPRHREVRERIHRNQSCRYVGELELKRLDREEHKTRESRPQIQARMKECERLRSELETAAMKGVNRHARN